MVQALDPELRAPALIAVSTVFESLGRTLIWLDEAFHIVHTSELLTRLIGVTAAGALVGRPVGALVSPELFAPGGALRSALEAGERREGWRGTLALAKGMNLVVSLSVAPLIHDRFGICDERVAYIVEVTTREEARGGAVPDDREELARILAEHHWRRDEVARKLGISRTTLWRRMREAGLVGRER